MWRCEWIKLTQNRVKWTLDSVTTRNFCQHVSEHRCLKRILILRSYLLKAVVSISLKWVLEERNMTWNHNIKRVNKQMCSKFKIFGNCSTKWKLYPEEVPEKTRNFFTRWITVSFWRRTLFHSIRTGHKWIRIAPSSEFSWRLINHKVS